MNRAAIVPDWHVGESLGHVADPETMKRLFEASLRAIRAGFVPDGFCYQCSGGQEEEAWCPGSDLDGEIEIDEAKS